MPLIKLKKTASRLDFSGAMTDISFLLIVFFLISAVFVADKGVFLRLPDRDTPPKVLKPDEVIRISIIEPGIYTVNEQIIEPADLKLVIAERARFLLDPIAVITVAQGIKYQEVLTVLEESQKAGCSAFSVKSVENRPVGVKIEGR